MGKIRKRRAEVTPFREDGQVYARVIKMMGNGRCTTIDADNVERLGIIRGNMRSREWVSPKDIVLLCLRDFQDAKADIVHRYTDAEVKMLAAHGEIDVRFSQCVDPDDEDDDAVVIFEDGDDVDAI